MEPDSHMTECYKAWHYAAELCSLPVIYSLCGLVLTDTTDNPSEKRPSNFTAGYSHPEKDAYFVPTIMHNLIGA